MTDRDHLDDVLGRLDRPEMPSTDFARDLRARLLAEFDADARSAGDPNPMHPIALLPISTPTLARTDQEPRRGRTWMIALEIAAAILVLFGFAAAIIGPDGLSDGLSALIPGRNEQERVPLGPAAMFGGDAARTGKQPGPAPANQPKLRWTLSLPNGSSALMPPVAVAGTLYDTVNEPDSSDPDGGTVTTHLRAVDLASGTERWRYPVNVFGGVAATAEVVVANILIPAEDHTDAGVIALDARDGHLLWQITTSDPAGWISDLSPLIIGDLVYTATPDGAVWAFDARTGQQQWMSSAAHSSASRMESRTGPPPITSSGQIAAGDGLLYVVNGGGHLIALDAGSGEARWDIDVRDRFQVRPERVDVIALDGVVLISLLGIDEAPDMVQRDGTARVIAPARVIATVEADTGLGLWRYDAGGIGANASIAGGNAIVPGVAVDGTQERGTLTAIDLKTGEVAWTITDMTQAPIGISVAGDAVYVAGRNGGIAAVDAVNGTVLWDVSVGEDLSTAPVIVDGLLLVVDDPGTVYAFGTTGSASPTPANAEVEATVPTPLPPTAVPPTATSPAAVQNATATAETL